MKQDLDPVKDLKFDYKRNKHQQSLLFT